MKHEAITKSQSILRAALIVLLLSGVFAPEKSQAYDIAINISPNIINLESMDHTFGIHTSIPYSDVNIDEVILVCPNDYELYPTVCYADSLGNLVAKFDTSDLEADCGLVIGTINTLVLEGETLAEPEPFAGTGEVLIIESQPGFQKGKGSNNTQNKNCRNK